MLDGRSPELPLKAILVGIVIQRVFLVFDEKKSNQED